MRERKLVFVFSVACLTISFSSGEVLTPPYFNLADGRRITATATCGEGTPEPELYCKLVGANADRDVNINLIQGQVCDVCDPSRPDKMHPASFAIDGAETWWQSPPLSRSMKLNEVNLTIDFGQAFHVAYVFIRMANSPRPGVWALERSIDNGVTFTPWQYFADTPNDCETYFGKQSLKPITQDDTVICDTQFSKVVPLEGGEIVVSLLNNRPSAKDFFNSTVLQEWTKATNVRLRFLRTKTLLGHLMSVARQDPTVTRRYFYSIKDISIGGRCMCNGHADTCDNTDPRDPYKLVCRCQHNTCGDQCQTCCRGYQQKAWKQSKANALFVCEECNCYGHSEDCEYSEEIDKQHLSIDIHGNYIGGGVCKNCRHNTEGINCNKCKNGFYRPFGRSLNATDVCEKCQCDVYYSTGNCTEGTGKCECRKEFQEPRCDSCSFGYFGYPDCKPCECFQNGTRGYHCEADGGACPCKPNFGGKFCYHCAEGFYDFPNCLACDCNSIGSVSPMCSVEDGNCTCKNNFGGRTCDSCKNGYYNYPDCRYCSCDAHGTLEEVCDKESGACLCKEGFGGERCDQCIPGYYGYPDCKPCNCSEKGSSLTGCDLTGKCTCLFNFAGRVCDQCSPGFYQYPDCLSCECDPHGSIGISCDNSGKCRCKNNFESDKCNTCKEGFYNFPACEDCNCDPSGIIAGFAGCGSVPPGELCQCKPRVQGRICNECRPLFWNLRPGNPDGCEECNCHIPGVLGGIGECDLQSGQCVCKPGVESRRCDLCRDGFYGLDENDLFGCTDCGCDIGGAIDRLCDKDSGQCICQPRVTGRDCKQPHEAHYFPTLYSQLQFEAEDSRTPSGSPVRYDYSQKFFPNFSWKGYAIFSQLQGEIIQDIFINKPSLYRMVMRYVNPTNETVTGTIKIVPDNVNEVPQTFYVQLKPSKKPTLVTVSGPGGDIPSPLVMNPGQWAVHISTTNNIFLDYFVLLPAAFYEATILEEKVETPCSINGPNLCRHFSYPYLNFDKADANEGFKTDDFRGPIQHFYKDFKHLSIIGEELLPILDANQSAFGLDINLSGPGRYVMVVNYVTPEKEWKPSTVSIETSTSTLKNKGIAQLFPCTHDQVCRQVSTDKLGRVAIYDFDTNFVSLTLKVNPEENSTTVIESVALIPVDKWSLDYIRPKTVCIKKDGKCLQTTFRTASGSSKIEFEQHAPDLLANQLPNEIYDNSTGTIYFSDSDSTLNIRGSVSTPGPYVFVVHYLQPEHPEFNMQVLVQNGQFHEAKLMVPHCPGNSGCRSVITQSDGNNQFPLNENFLLTFEKPDNKSLWLDYLLAIPAETFSEALLEEEPVDQTSVFISQCGNNHFDISPNTTGFCRDAVFSLTTQYYDGALKCECHYQGSLSFECEKFGGQCQCKENIMGRRCDLCKPGYFGFPNCRACSCPAPSTCHNETGECICPPKVTGHNCSECESKTFGYDIIYGCEDCNCHPDGVEDDNLQCDLYTGVCQCKKSIEGRTCDHCKPGHYGFPGCAQCLCDRRGTTDEVCDDVSSVCFCKPNVYGLACDLCKEGTFHIDRKNPNGCTKCFCFGKTTRCSSSNLYRSQISELDQYDIAAIATSTSSVDVTMLDGAGEPETKSEDKVIYFALPKAYLGNRLTSYGGFLNYTLSFGSAPSGDSISGPDIILYGSDIYLIHYALYRPTESTPFSFQVEILEKMFQVLTGLPSTREQLMQVLGNLTAVYVRAKYGSYVTSPRLLDATLDIATKTYSPSHAKSVEQCHCPPNYQGLSCEECAPGFYRAQGGPYGGYCVPCQCNGHADTCDQVTGQCMDCKHNTYGDHCEFCSVGYHGNATVGTPFDCLICACPLPTPSNNFATSCDVSEDGEHISCNCLPGYSGARCESCSAGYYGRPEYQGDSCKKCNCSGNINPDDPASCDSITGDCLRCLNNTFGTACNLCAPGYYGDAVHLKDCKTCDCDKCGIQSCESYTGQCICQDNVIGERCDRCAPDHYGFDECNGCYPCNCGLASEHTYCNISTGQCPCQPGATGRTCDACAPGFWNYSETGCLSCGCNIEYSIGVGCNPVTGQCECLPGVIGDRCDQCPHRWVLIPDRGCFECNSCTHDLLDTTDYLRNLIDPVVTEFKTVADGYFTTQRLRYFNDTAANLSMEVKKLDPSRLQLTPVITALDDLESNVKSAYRKAEFAKGRGYKSASDGQRVRVEALDVEDLVRQAADESGNTVLEVTNLANSVDGGNGHHYDSAVQESIHLLERIKDLMLAPYLEKAEHEEKNATVIRDKMKNFTIPIANQSRNLEKIFGAFKEFDDKLEDLRNNTASAEKIANKAFMMNNLNKDAKLTSKVYTIRNMTKDANDTLADAKTFLRNASDALKDARDATAELYREKNKANDANQNLNSTLLKESSELTALHNLVEKAKDRAEDLVFKARALNDSMEEIKKTSNVAAGVEAGEAYPNIAEDINEAEKLAKEANEYANRATKLGEGVGTKTDQVKNFSDDLLQQGMTALKQVQSDLQPQLDDAMNEVKEVENKNADAVSQEEYILKELNSMSNETSLESASRRAMDESEMANSTAQNTLANIKAITDKVPEEVIQAKQLPKDIGAIKHDVSQARNQLNRVNAILPDINRLMTDLKDTQSKLKGKENAVNEQIDRLKRQVAEARDLASRVNVGVTFQPNTFVELKNPEDLAKQSTSTKVSAYFKSDKPNGALLYLGNEIGTSRKLKRAHTDDFLSVELENGHPSVVVDLGSGPQRINSDVNITLGKWYQFVVERTGKHVKLTVLEESENGEEIKHVKEEVLPGAASILNLDPEESKIYVGGHPASAKIQSAVKYSSFEGQMEDLVIGETPASLWNFKEAEYTRGAQKRNRLVNLNPSTGYRFNGNGYAILDSRPYRMDTRSVVSLKFKTTSKEGLLFLIGKGRYFLSLEIKNGKVVYQYNLGGGTAIFTTEDSFNDNRWHVVEATRLDQNGVLKVDDIERYKSNADGPGKYLHVSDDMYFGGYPGKHHYESVTNLDFDGCIDDVHVDATSVDLSKHEAAFGVTPGCPVKFSSMVSLKGDNYSYIRYNNASVDKLIDLSLRFKTGAPSGIILLTEARDGSGSFSLSLLNGELVILSSGSILKSSDSPPYNDSQWHTITATHNREGITLSVDDLESFSLAEKGGPPSFKFGSLLIGGIPNGYVAQVNSLGVFSAFVGCIADVTFNGVLVNFANSTDYNGATVGRCSETDVDSAIIPHGAPSIPTEEEVLKKMEKVPGLPGGREGHGENIDEIEKPDEVDEKFNSVGGVVGGTRGKGKERGEKKGKGRGKGKGGKQGSSEVDLGPDGGTDEMHGSKTRPEGGKEGESYPGKEWGGGAGSEGGQEGIYYPEGSEGSAGGRGGYAIDPQTGRKIEGSAGGVPGREYHPPPGKEVHVGGNRSEDGQGGGVFYPPDGRGSYGSGIDPQTGREIGGSRGSPGGTVGGYGIGVDPETGREFEASRGSAGGGQMGGVPGGEYYPPPGKEIFIGGNRSEDGRPGVFGGKMTPEKGRKKVHEEVDADKREGGRGIEGGREFDRDIDNELDYGRESDKKGKESGRGGTSSLDKIPEKKPKKIPEPKPTPMGLCALPLEPAQDPNASFLNGYQFGTQNGSRLEFNTLPGKNKNTYNYSLEFKTHYPDGLLFYASDKRHTDFTALYIKEGKLFYGFNCGSGAALITEPGNYADGKWHHVRITKENTIGNLIVDGGNPISGESSGSAKTLNVVPPYYLGGFDPTTVESAKHNIQGLEQSFAGCVRKFTANNKEVEPTVKEGILPCSEHTEPGIFFASGGGYVRAVDSFKVGFSIELRLKIKPRSTSGVLVAIHGKRDYLFVQMVKGVIEFTVDTGKGPFTSAYRPGDEYFFCDGNWHEILAIQAKNIIVLAVNGISVAPGIGAPGSLSTDTKNPVYLGSAGPRGHRQRGNLTAHHYVGCMKELTINGNLLNLNTHRIFGNVTFSSCPTN